MLNAVFLFEIHISKINKFFRIGATTHKFIDTKEHFSVYFTLLIIYHQPKVTVLVLKSLIRAVVEIALFLEIALRYTKPI